LNSVPLKPVDVDHQTLYHLAQQADLGGQAFKQSGVAARRSHHPWGSEVLEGIHTASLLLTE